MDCFKLFACCLLTKGHTRSLIIDNQRDEMHFIPNGLYEILKKYNGKSIENVKTAYENKFDEIIDEYFEFLLEKELIFFTDTPELFPEIELTYESPTVIENAIIDINKESDHDYRDIFFQLENLGCKAIQFRIYEDLDWKTLSNMLCLLNTSVIRHIQIFIPYQELVTTKENITQLMKDYNRIQNIFVHSAPENTDVEMVDRANSYVFIKQEIHDHTQCGFISPKYFHKDLSNFSKSQHFNTCLYKKISLDVHGEIRNCPAMNLSFGNIKVNSFARALKNEELLSLWHINKDQIQTCRDCEFRHICTDCRAFIQEPDNKYAKPSKCTYDPYSGQWG